MYKEFSQHLNGFVCRKHDMQTFKSLFGQVRSGVKNQFLWEIVDMMSQLAINLGSGAVLSHTINRRHYGLLNNLHPHISRTINFNLKTALFKFVSVVNAHCTVDLITKAIYDKFKSYLFTQLSFNRPVNI